MKRRDFLNTIASISVGALLARYLNFGQKEVVATKFYKDVPLSGKIFGLGIEGGRGPHGSLMALSQQALLWDLNLKSGEFRKTTLDMPYGHSILFTPNTELFCLPISGPLIFVTDVNHKVMHKIQAPDGYLFSGHAQIFENKGVIIAPVKTVDDLATGGLMIYDAKDFSKNEFVSISIKYPHDVAKSLDGNTAIIANGYDSRKMEVDDSRGNEPTLIQFDIKTNKVISSFSQVVLSGLNHVAIDSQSNIYFSQLTAIKIEEEMIKKLKKDFPSSGDWYWGSGVGRRPEYIPYPSPLFQTDLQKNLKKIMSRPDLHLRNQDVKYLSSVRKIVSTYSESNSLIFYGEKSEDVQYVQAKRYGISKVRGVCEIPGSKLFAVNDSELGVAIVDGESLDLVSFFSEPLYLTRHISFLKA